MGTAFTTDDAQVSLIIAQGTIAAAAGASSVVISVEPLDPAEFGRPPNRLVIRGNVYRITARYEPTGERVSTLVVPIQTILAYPFQANDLADHTLIVTANGRRWSVADSKDHLGAAQVVGTLPRFGYIAAASPPFLLPSSPAAPSPTPGESIPVPIVIVGVVLIVLLAGVALGSRGERRRRPPTRSG
jgi:hypothetical protein